MIVQATGAQLHLVALVVRPTTMNMLDDEAKYLQPPHESYSHLSQIEWDAVERLRSTIGQEVVGPMLSALRPDGQNATIANFIQNKLDAERGKVTLPHH